MRTAGSRRAFCGDRRGGAAIEFAMVAPLFFALIFSTFEAGWMMTKAIMLDRALDIAVRAVRVGGTDAMTAAGVRTLLCKETLVIPNCESVVTIEMTKIASANDFPSSAATCIDRSASAQAAPRFDANQRATIMLIRACATTDTLTPLIGLALQLPKDSSGGYSTVASIAFMTEPGA